MHSTYRWQGAVEHADEVLLLIKTTRVRMPAVQERIVALHPYELPGSARGRSRAACPRTCNGSRAKPTLPLKTDDAHCMTHDPADAPADGPARPAIGRLCVVAAHAVDEKDLLPVDQAFALDAKATSRDAIALTWRIAPGYYLYRHRIEGGGRRISPAPRLQMPPGKHKRDEFFGDVETYRTLLEAKVVGTPAADARSVTLKVKYQGCADVGVCYPPQTRHACRCALPSDRAGGLLGAPAPAGPLAIRRREGRTALPESRPSTSKRSPTTATRCSALHAGARLLPLSRQDAAHLRAVKASRCARRNGRPASSIATSTSAMSSCISIRSTSRCRCSARTHVRSTARCASRSRAARTAASAIR